MGQRHFKKIKKFVVLRHLTGPNLGQCFWTTADESGGDNTRSAEGDVWYKEVLFTNDADEAIVTCSGAAAFLPGAPPRGKFMARLSRDQPGVYG